MDLDDLPVLQPPSGASSATTLCYGGVPVLPSAIFPSRPYTSIRLRLARHHLSPVALSSSLLTSPSFRFELRLCALLRSLGWLQSRPSSASLLPTLPIALWIADPWCFLQGLFGAILPRSAGTSSSLVLPRLKVSSLL